MKMIMAIDNSAKETHRGQWLSCLNWAQNRANESHRPVQIVVMRPGAREAPIVAEVTSQGVRPLDGTRVMPIKRILKHYG